MEKRDITAAIVDGVLRIGVTSGAIAAGLLIPNLLIGLEKPLDIFWKQLDKRERERELRRTISYMKTKNLLQGDYEHGLQITIKGRERLKKAEFRKMIIPAPTMWDQKWRLIFFDIPEDKKYERDMLTRKLKILGFYQLQKSVWIHPFPCRDVIEIISSQYEVDSFVSYIEVTYIDNQQKLKERFKKII